MSIKFLLKCCVKWNPPLGFQGIHEDLYPALVEAADSHDLIETACIVNDVFGVHNDQIKSPVLMEEYSTKSLCSEDLPYIVKHWPPANQYTNPSEYLGTLLSCFPTIGVFDCHGDMAAHAGLYDYGAVGFLGVDEKHQRKGLGKFVLSKMFNIGKRSGIIPHTNIIHSNVASVNLHRAAAIQQITQKCEMFVFYK